MTEQKNINQKILRIGYFILAVVLLIFGTLIFFGFYGIYDRKQRTEEIKQAQANDASRSMLNARARVQAILITAQMEGRKLTPSEVDEIQKLWKTAEYDQATTSEQK